MQQQQSLLSVDTLVFLMIGRLDKLDALCQFIAKLHGDNGNDEKWNANTPCAIIQNAGGTRLDLEIKISNFRTKAQSGIPKHPLTMTVPDGAACYFCLGEEADEEGKPLVRDCSCRGDSGFAHLSCLAQYAEQKCKAAGDGDFDAFSTPWYTCNNCKQPFQNQLSVDLASAFVEFAQATYDNRGSRKWDKLRVMESLRLNIVALLMLNDYSNEVADEKRRIINHLLSMVEQTKKDYKMSRWIHMPKDSEEYQYYRFLHGNYEAFTNEMLGAIAYRAKESMMITITHFKKARAIYNLVGEKEDVQRVEGKIDGVTAMMQSNDQNLSTKAASTVLPAACSIYENNLNRKGMDSEDTIRTGLCYARQLWDAKHCIEAERLVTKLATISRRVNGPEHKVTVDADVLLQLCKERFVVVLPNGQRFQALRYENDGEICVVTGPITEPRQVDEEREHSVESHLIHPVVGCAVICHGLVSASHLNGELGEVRDAKLNANATGIRLGMNFEKKSLKSALVKPENLRIAFELPSSSKE